jgi:hypothetical protein
VLGPSVRGSWVGGDLDWIGGVEAGLIGWWEGIFDRDVAGNLMMQRIVRRSVGNRVGLCASWGFT